jgi:hypothetical protein
VSVHGHGPFNFARVGWNGQAAAAVKVKVVVEAAEAVAAAAELKNRVFFDFFLQFNVP